jgi:hypothetical protein
VIDSVSGQPISRALVQSGSQGVLTDHEGHFVLEHSIPPSARKPGYFEDQPGTRTADDGSWLLKLTPEAVLYGTVTDANAQPIQQLKVDLHRLEVRSGLAYWQQTNVTTTNAEGEFRFADLAEGKYTLSTGFLVDGLPDARSSLGFVPTMYPPPGSGSASEAGEATVTLHAGDHLEANISPPEEKLYTVTGTIPGPFRGNFAWMVETAENLPLDPAMSSFPDGRFRVRLPLGTYRIKVVSTVDNQQFAGSREITVGPAGLEGVTLNLAANASIPVEVEFEHGNTGQQPAQPGFPSLTLAGQDPGSGRSMYTAQPQGSYTGLHVPHAEDPLVIPNIEPGRYLLQTSIPPPWYVASATCGNLDLTRDPLVIGEGSGVCSMHVTLRDDSASLHWSVADAGKANSVTVMAFPLGNLSLNPVGGQFEPSVGSFEGLAPGRYLVIASEHSLNFAFRDPQVLEKYQTEGQEVTVAPGSQSDIELKLAPNEP